jgi:2-methylcitrate dehydratase PrpD
MRGMPQNPMTSDDIVRKFRSNVAGSLADSQVDRVIDMIMSLERIDGVAELMMQLDPRTRVDRR